LRHLLDGKLCSSLLRVRDENVSVSLPPCLEIFYVASEEKFFFHLEYILCIYKKKNVQKNFFFNLFSGDKNDTIAVSDQKLRDSYKYLCFNHIKISKKEKEN
jgi:hypothetical protein